MSDGRRSLALHVPKHKRVLIDKVELIAVREQRSHSEVLLMILENEIDWYVEHPERLAQGKP